MDQNEKYLAQLKDDKISKTIGLALLTHNRPAVLNQTLTSYKEKGFFDIFDEKIILLQENLPESRKIAEKYDVTIYSTDNNIGIGLGNNFLVNKLKTDYFIICQDDFLLIKNNYNKEIFKSIDLIESKIIDCHRLRNLEDPGEPMYSSKRHLKPKGTLNKENASGLLYYNFLEKPQDLYPDIIHYNEEYNIYILSSKYANFTENPVLYDRKWYIKHVYNLNKISGRQAELNNQKYWEKQDFKISFGPGLFKHCDKVIF